METNHTHMHTHEHPHEHDHEHHHDHEHFHDHGHFHDHEHPHTHGHGHKHVHSMEEKKAVLNRLSRIAGHLEAIKRMVENDEDCSQVLIQLAAVRSAVNNTGKVVLKNHINHCVIEAIEEHDTQTLEDLEKAIDQFMK